MILIILLMLMLMLMLIRTQMSVQSGLITVELWDLATSAGTFR